MSGAAVYAHLCSTCIDGHRLDVEGTPSGELAIVRLRGRCDHCGDPAGPREVNRALFPVRTSCRACYLAAGSRSP